MIRTSLCDLLGIDTPIVQAGMGVFTSAELVAAVSNAGGLGSLGAGLRPADDLKRQLARIRELTDRPFAINFTLNSQPDPRAFAEALAARPRVLSFALADPGEYARVAHDAGILVMHQVTSVDQARQAIACGVDILIAQGSEAGGFGGSVSALPLVPQVIDVADSTPVLAAGGIADGRGLAAMLTLGAQGVNVGTRFLASVEAPIDSAWKQMIVHASSEETVKFDAWGAIFPLTPGAYEIEPRTLPTAFTAEWLHHPADAMRHADEIRAAVLSAIRQGTMHEIMPWAGESVGLISDVLPAAEIVRKMSDESARLMSRQW